MTRLLKAAIFAALCAATLAAQGTGPIFNLSGKVDSNNALVVSSVAIGTATAQGQPIGNLQGKVDSNNALVVTMNGGTLTGPVTIDGGTQTGASSPPLAVTQTWNNAATTFIGPNITITDTASAAGSLPFRILCGAGAATTCLSVSKAGVITAGSNLIAGGSVQAADANNFRWATRNLITAPADGMISTSNAAGTIGSQLKFDALPTIASGFGSSPTIVAKSTPLDGAVNVGTGGVATSGVINFNGTAFTTAPFCVITPSLTNGVTRPTTITTMESTLTTTTAWTASDIVYWHCIGPNT